MLELERINDEVFIAKRPVVSFGAEAVEFLKARARSSLLKRARICAHRSTEDTLHEMLIVIGAGSYIRPHKHFLKSESFHIVEGVVDVVIFDDAGTITQVVRLGEASSGRDFFYRLSDSRFHTLILRTDFLVMHEVTNGPFEKIQTEQALFAPHESDAEAVECFTRDLAEDVVKFEGGTAQ